ncbi:ABC transporter permease [Pseudochrobactrum sp. MP213Fo]|uniref:ABC transporter permease n=1 Tax=Pseudochrobactrum sp. MP213Fo TaxID=3022250 RepID=UPI003BA3281E
MLNIYKNACSDLQATFKLRRVWIALASEDISDAHKRTTLGPIWLLLNYLAFVGAFAFVVLSTKNDPIFISYMAIGLLVWFFITDVITNATNLFTKEESFIKGTPLPLSLYVMRLFMQACIRSFYSSIGCVAILLIFGVSINWGWLLGLLSIILILIISPAVITVFAFIGVFFPDSKYLVHNAMRVGMFLTPIFWTYEGSGGIRHLFYAWSPFTYFLDTVRTPVIYSYIPLNSLMICCTIGAALWIIAIYMLGKFKKEVVFLL